MDATPVVTAGTVDPLMETATATMKHKAAAETRPCPSKTEVIYSVLKQALLFKIGYALFWGWDMQGTSDRYLSAAGTGLNPVELESTFLAKKLMLWLLMMLCNPIMINTAVICVSVWRSDKYIGRGEESITGDGGVKEALHAKDEWQQQVGEVEKVDEVERVEEIE